MRSASWMASSTTLPAGTTLDTRPARTHRRPALSRTALVNHMRVPAGGRPHHRPRTLALGFGGVDVVAREAQLHGARLANRTDQALRAPGACMSRRP